jgi:hypothetical protein
LFQSGPGKGRHPGFAVFAAAGGQQGGFRQAVTGIKSLAAETALGKGGGKTIQGIGLTGSAPLKAKRQLRRSSPALSWFIHKPFLTTQVEKPDDLENTQENHGIGRTGPRGLQHTGRRLAKIFSSRLFSA